MEERIDEEDTAVTPYFENVFEGLCQFIDVLQSHSDEPTDKPKGLPNYAHTVRAKSALLARRPTKSFATDITYTPAQFHRSLYHFVGLESKEGKEMVLAGRFHIATLEKL